MSGTFEIKTTKNGQFMFNLRAGNNEVILTSETYTTKQSAKTGIASVKTNAPVDAQYKRKTGVNGKPFFVLEAANGEPIGTSQHYENKQNMETGIASVKATAPTAKTVDLTQPLQRHSPCR